MLLRNCICFSRIEIIPMITTHLCFGMCFDKIGSVSPPWNCHRVRKDLSNSFSWYLASHSETFASPLPDATKHICNTGFQLVTCWSGAPPVTPVEAPGAGSGSSRRPSRWDWAPCNVNASTATTSQRVFSNCCLPRSIFLVPKQTFTAQNWFLAIGTIFTAKKSIYLRSSRTFAAQNQLLRYQWIFATKNTQLFCDQYKCFYNQNCCHQKHFLRSEYCSVKILFSTSPLKLDVLWRPKSMPMLSKRTWAAQSRFF